MTFDRAWSLTALDERRAPQRLGEIVAHLTQQKWRQLFVDYGWVGLFWGLTISAVTVLALKAHTPDMPTQMWSALIIGGALSVAIVKAWANRPDKLTVAIQADVALKLKQQLSTAWEFAQTTAEPEIVKRLAVQAVNQRYPPPSQAVFALRLNTWARLVPIAALALILVSVLDLAQLSGPALPVIDDVVVSEGVRLREFAQQMQMRAARDALPRSEQESEKLRRLGSRMESGSLSRQEAVSRLQELGESLTSQRRAALSDGGMESGLAESFSPKGNGESDASQLKKLLEQLLQGKLTPGEIAALSQESESLSRLGISIQDLSSALDSYAAGDPFDVQEMVENLQRQELAIDDAGELSRAIQQIDQVRENLGDVIVSAEDLMNPGGGSDNGEVQAFGGLMGRGGGASESGPMDQAGYSSGSGETPRHEPRTLDPKSDRNDIVLKPQSEFREGSGFTTETRVLPRAGHVTVESVELDVRFHAQMEEILSKDDYPLHLKEFIRRYFLNLSQGVSSGGQANGE